MPELAEVETVRNTLKDLVLNKEIKDIEIIYPKIIEGNLKKFKEGLIGKAFIDIQRRGKYLIFETPESYLISHLRMEGKYFYQDEKSPAKKHEHLIFVFDKGVLIYHDVRKFGRMQLISKAELETYFKDLGPEANSDVDVNYLKAKLNNKKAIKALLLDQSILAGLGNIYVDEVLYYAGLRPDTPGCNLDEEDYKKILGGSKAILNKAIEHRGTTIRSYTSSLGVYGNYQDYLKVHTKKECACGNPISKMKIGGRTSYYCDKCQKAK